MPVYCRECLPEKKQANYGEKGKTPTCCSMHGKARGFINVTHTRCDHDGCKQYANYGAKGGKLTRCRTHKTGEMIDVVRKRCDHDGCDQRANCGINGGRPTRCHKHKLPDMINVVTQRCSHDECEEFAVYGIKGGKRTHCRAHKTGEMIDVVHKRCDHDGCNELAIYGAKGDRLTCCRTHKLPKMIYLAGTRCNHGRCNEHAVYGIKGGKRTRCCIHKTDKMVNVVSPLCTSCKMTSTREKDKLCSACRQCLQLGASRKLIRIERRIIDMLILHGTIIDDDRTKFNKSIGAECGGYRPDIYIDCGTFILVIEIDEHQHRPRYISRIVDGVATPMVVAPYSSECENKRMMSIVSKEQMPVYFIRINPDKCTIDGKDINVSFEKRCEALRTLIKSVMEGGTPDAWMTVTYMYYDGALERTVKPDLPAGF